MTKTSDRRDGWRGFEGGRFLTDAEHTVYCRRLPVRYAAKSAGPSQKFAVCAAALRRRETPCKPRIVFRSTPASSNIGLRRTGSTALKISFGRTGRFVIKRSKCRLSKLKRL